MLCHSLVLSYHYSSIKKYFMKTKQQLIDRVIEVLKEQIEHGDETVIDELFHFIPCKNLVNCLNEGEWEEYKNLLVV